MFYVDFMHNFVVKSYSHSLLSIIHISMNDIWNIRWVLYRGARLPDLITYALIQSSHIKISCSYYMYTSTIPFTMYLPYHRLKRFVQAIPEWEWEFLKCIPPVYWLCRQLSLPFLKKIQFNHSWFPTSAQLESKTENQNKHVFL